MAEAYGLHRDSTADRLTDARRTGEPANIRSMPRSVCAPAELSVFWQA